MKPFAQLTPSGRARRLRQLVSHALRQYDFEVRDLRLVGLFTNALFRVRTAQNQAYIMRVCRPGWRTQTDLNSEIMWLLALADDTTMRVPEPIPAANGAFIVESQVAGVPEPRRCVLMRWVPGALLAERLNEDNLFKMGRLFARLHEHGANFDPPEGFTGRRMDSIYARDEPDVLFSQTCRDFFSPEARPIIERTDEKVREAFADLYRDPGGIQVIHNDLHHENIKVYYGELCPLDFEDTIWGYPVQDIAMALQDLMLAVEPAAYETFQAAFRAGYETLKLWPESYEGQIDTFRAGRMIWVANYVARFQRRYLREHLDWLARQFERYLATGSVRKS